MSEVKYGLSREGFKRKRLPEILADMKSRMSDSAGLPIESSANSVLGQLFGVIAYEISDLWQMAEAGYHAMYPNSATGVSLSNAAGLAGITAITAEHTTMRVTCTGSNGTYIPYGSRIQSKTDTAKVFVVIDEGAYIDANNANRVTIQVTAEPKKDVEYNITINGKVISYIAVEGNDQAAVLSGIAAAIDIDGITGAVSNNVLTVETTDRSVSYSIAASAGLLVTTVSALVRVRCETAGAIAPEIGEVDQIITPVSGWNSVKNEIAAVVGRDAESDTALRQRWSSSLYERSSAMVESIQAAIYKEVDGVATAIVYENTGDTVDESFRPPHRDRKSVV